MLGFMSCTTNPEYIFTEESYTSKVVDKKEAIKTEHVYTENIFGPGDNMFKKVPETKTVYYVIFDNGDVDQVDIKSYYKYNIGQSYIRYRTVKKHNPDYIKR